MNEYIQKRCQCAVFFGVLLLIQAIFLLADVRYATADVATSAGYVLKRNVMDSSGNTSSASYKSSIVAGEISSSAVTTSAAYQLRSGYLISGSSSALPVVTTQAVTDISTTTATGNGTLSDLGSPNPTAYGVCWGTAVNPTIADATVNKGAATATGIFTAGMTGLASGTTYHVRAYATNTAGTSYGVDRVFTTTAPPPPPPPPPPPSYTVSFNLDGKGSRVGGGALIQNVSDGSSAAAPSVQANAGYTFIGWDRGFSDVHASMTVIAQYAVKTFTLTYTAGAGGSITGSTAQTVSYGASGAQVTATPAAGHTFTGWSDGSTANPRTDTNVTSNISVNALFASTVYQLTVQDGTGDGKYKAGTVVTISAAPAPDGMIFDRWTGGSAAVANVTLANTSLTMPEADVTVSASYKEKPIKEFILTVIDGTGDGRYKAGTVVSISAAPAPDGMIFDQWTGGSAAVANAALANTSLTMPEADVSVIATYREKPIEKFALTVSSGTGSGDYEAGTVVSIAATPPQEGMIFHRWTGQISNIANVNIPNTTLTMPGSSVGVTATYKTDPGLSFALEIRVESQGSQRRIADKSALRNGNSKDIPAGQLVSLIAPEPPEGYVFYRWIGQIDRVTNVDLAETTIYMPDSDVVVIATYRPVQGEERELSVQNGSGSGIYAQQTHVSITADLPPMGEIFDKWTGQTGNVVNINLPETVIVMPGSDVIVQAVYRERPAEGFALTVNEGSGSGTYPAATWVEITAEPPPEGYIFDKWQGQNATVADISSATTFVFMPPNAVMVMATYILSETGPDEGDTDQDGIADAWEIDNYGDIFLNAEDYDAMDTDGDGYTDLEEYRNGTDLHVPDQPINGYLVLMNDVGYLLTSGSHTKVYGNDTANHLILENGATAECFSFPGKNVFTLSSASAFFNVSRAGVTVSLDGPNRTSLVLSASTTPQTIIFTDGAAELKIEQNVVLFGEQAVTSVPNRVDTPLGPAPDIQEHPSGDISEPDAYLLVTGKGVCWFRKGSSTEVYAISDMNSLELEAGAAVKVVEFAESITVTVGSNSQNFEVFRSGSTVVLSGSDGTELMLTATLNLKSIRFSDRTLELGIDSGQVLLGEQVVGLQGVAVK